MHLEKCKMTFAKLLLIACLLQGYAFQLIIIEDQCSVEETLNIRQKNLDWLDENIRNSEAFSEHKLTELRQRILESFESSPVSLVLSEIDATVGTLKSGECIKQIRAKSDLQKLTLFLLEDKCVTKSRKKETSLESKTDSVLAKIRSGAKKSELALQKCALTFGGCSVIENCSQMVVLQLVEKIESSKYKIDGSSEKLISEQNACLKNVANKALIVKEDVEKEVLECSLQGSGLTDSSEITEADVSGESNESTEESSKDDSSGTNNHTTESSESSRPSESNEINDSGSSESAKHNSSHSSESTEVQHSLRSDDEETENEEKVRTNSDQIETSTTTNAAGEQTDPISGNLEITEIEKGLETHKESEEKTNSYDSIQSGDENDVTISNQSDDHNDIINNNQSEEENHLKSS